MQSTQKNRCYRLGLFAEWVTCWYLRAKGFSIHSKRFRTPVGEIDVIAYDREHVLFVEVKARTKNAEWDVLSPHQARRITRAASLFLQQNPTMNAKTCRFDLIIVRPFSWPEHIKGAWEEK